MRRKILLTLIIIGAALTLLIVKFPNRYSLPGGYETSRIVWQEMGLPDRNQDPADGSTAKPYDVIVWGSDPEGITAAVAAARNGLATLLLDRRDRVGGLFTVGQLNFIDVNYDQNKKLVTKGIFEEFYQKAGGVVFAIDRGQQVFDEMLAAEKLITVGLNYDLIGPLAADQADKITGIKVKTRTGKAESFYGQIVIDASQDADLAVLAGVPFTKGMEDIGLPGKTQAATLVFKLKGLHWPTIMWETLVKGFRQQSKATFTAAWGYTDYIKKYEPLDASIAFRGFNMARQKNGEVLINGLLIYGVDAADPHSRDAAKAAAQQEAHRFTVFARENLPGFQQAEIAGFAEELYIRESNHMQGLYRLTLDDVLENRDHPDRIGYGSYPVDIQALDKHSPGIAIGAPDKYALPLRSLVPPNYTNLLVVGRSASYDSLAHGSARIVGVGMVAGQAAGVTAAYALATGKTFPAIATNHEDMRFIQKILASQGAYVEPSTSPPPRESQHPHYAALKRLRNWGLIVGGYQNQYQLNEPLPAQAFLNLLFHTSVRGLNLREQYSPASQCYFVIDQAGGPVTAGKLAAIVANFAQFNPHLKEFYDDEVWQALIREKTAALPPEATIPRGELYELVARYQALLLNPTAVNHDN